MTHDRPRWHFTPGSGWLNDPLALTWHNGRYHLFFQYVPGRTTWSPECRWGHASSPDLFSWTEHPVALEPGDGDDGIWSGSLAVDDTGRAVIFYTAVSTPEFGVGRIRTATPVDDSWLVWAKGEVVAEAPPLDLVAFRDPFLMRDGDRWRMLVGTAIVGGDAAASSFISDDLRSWSFDGLAASRNTSETNPVWTGALWECPQIFSIDGRDVMVTSVWQDDELHYVAYAIGTFADGRFDATSWGRLTFGDSYYAPSFFRDRDGLPCLISWMRGAGDATAGRASALSVPHVLRLEGETLVAEPHPGVALASASARTRIAVGEEWTTQCADGVLTIRRERDSTVCTWQGRVTVVPAGDREVEVLVDGETVEVFTGAALFGVGSGSVFTAGSKSP